MPKTTKTPNKLNQNPTVASPPHLLYCEEFSGVQVHPKVDLPERAAPDQLALAPPDLRALLSPSPSPAVTATATAELRRRREQAARRRGALGDEPEQTHPPRLPEARADPYPDPAPAPERPRRLRGRAGAEGDGPAHGVEQVAEPSPAGVVPSHGLGAPLVTSATRAASLSAAAAAAAGLDRVEEGWGNGDAALGCGDFEFWGFAGRRNDGNAPPPDRWTCGSGVVWGSGLFLVGYASASTWHYGAVDTLHRESARGGRVAHRRVTPLNNERSINFQSLSPIGRCSILNKNSKRRLIIKFIL